MTMRFLTRAALSGVALALMVSGAQAKPPFAEKEGKKCNYCHAPGPPKLGYRGLYYKMHNLTFESFDDAAEAKKAGVDVGPDPEPKPKSWTAPKGEAPKGEAPKAPEAPKGPSVASLKAKSDAASAALAKKPKDAKLKAAAAQAMAEYGHGQMLDQTVPPRMRYPQALATLRKAKALDPKNKLALEDIKAIEEAYTSMGQAIPK